MCIASVLVCLNVLVRLCFVMRTYGIHVYTYLCVCIYMCTHTYVTGFEITHLPCTQ